MWHSHKCLQMFIYILTANSWSIIFVHSLLFHMFDEVAAASDASSELHLKAAEQGEERDRFLFMSFDFYRFKFKVCAAAVKQPKWLEKKRTR